MPLNPPATPRNNQPRSLSIALGGGGGRGLTHLGVLQAIDESEHTVDHIVGTSIGAIAGAMYAIERDIETTKKKVFAFINSDKFRQRQTQLFGANTARGKGGPTTGWFSKFKRIFKAHKSITRAIRHSAILPDTLLRHVVETLLPDVSIESMSIPFSVVTVDLKSGRRLVLDRGPLRSAVQASASIPSVFPPVPYDDMLLADIGVYDSIPAAAAKSVAKDLTLAVDVSESVVPMEGCKNILEVFSRVQHLAECELRQHSLAHADLVVQPDIGQRAWFDFSEPDELIRMGQESAKQVLACVNTAAAPMTPGFPTLGQGLNPPVVQ